MGPKSNLRSLPQNAKLGNLAAENLQGSRVDLNTEWSLTYELTITRDWEVIVADSDRAGLEDFYLRILHMFTLVDGGENLQQLRSGNLVKDKYLELAISDFTIGGDFHTPTKVLHIRYAT